MTQRRRLDAFLLDAARERGVEVREGRPTVDTRPTARAADVVVGADGANGTTAQAVGLGDGIVHGVALEGNVPYRTLSSEALRAPRCDRARRHPRRLRLGLSRREITRTSASAPGSTKGRSSASTCSGSALRTGSSRTSSSTFAATGCRSDGRDAASPAERALLVGDAAGLIDPVSGDGMYECFVSARSRRRRSSTCSPDGRRASSPTQAAVDAELASLHGASWKLKRALDRWPRPRGGSLARRLLWRTVERLLQGDLESPGDQRGVARVPLRMLALLGR